MHRILRKGLFLRLTATLTSITNLSRHCMCRVGNHLAIIPVVRLIKCILPTHALLLVVCTIIFSPFPVGMLDRQYLGFCFSTIHTGKKFDACCGVRGRQRDLSRVPIVRNGFQASTISASRSMGILALRGPSPMGVDRVISQHTVNPVFALLNRIPLLRGSAIGDALQPGVIKCVGLDRRYRIKHLNKFQLCAIIEEVPANNIQLTRKHNLLKCITEGERPLPNRSRACRQT